jgi:hypothetical protein
MRRAKPPPIRNKIDLADPAQIRAWTRRLGITPGDLKRMVGKVGNSVAAVSKEIDLQRAPEPLKQPVPVGIDRASLPVLESAVAKVQIAATGS